MSRRQRPAKAGVQALPAASPYAALAMTLLQTQFAALARYNRWMNERLYALAEMVGEEQRRRDLGAFFGSIHRTLGHLLLADRIWLGRFGAWDAVTPASLAAELCPVFADLRRERGTTDDAIDAYVAALDDTRLAAPLRYLRAGQTIEEPLWWVVGHFFNHQTHHRGQVTTLFKQLGHDPGVTDLIAMLRDESVP